jgi:hypothetical protein
LFGGSGMLEKASQDFPFFFVQVSGIFPKRSKAAIELLIFFFGQGFLDA